MVLSDEELYNFKKRYFTVRYINILKYLDDDCIMTLYKMGITIRKGLYTEYHYDMIELDVLEYYYGNDESEESQKKLYDIGISEEEYLKVVKAFERIANDYNI